MTISITSLLGMRRNVSIAQTLADNVRRLMNHHDLSQAELGRRADVAQTLLSGLLNPSLQSNPNAKTVEKLAAYFKVTPWHLLIPDVALDLLLGDGFGAEIRAIVDTYVRAPDIGRQTIRRIAEAEGKYNDPEARTGTR